MKKNIQIILERARDGIEPIEILEKELLDLYLVSNRELIDDVNATLYKYKKYVLADNKLNLEEKQNECYRVQPLIRKLNDC